MGFLMFVPGQVSSSSVLSRTKRVVIFQDMLLLIGKQEKWCNAVTLVGFLIGSCYLKFLSN